MVLADGKGIPLGVSVHSASPAEVKLLEATRKQVSVGNGRNPERLILDLSYDSDALRDQLKRAGIEMVCPHRSNRERPARQDGRALRRYRKRWKIERTVAWLGNYRRVVMRWDRDVVIYTAFAHVACLLITLRHL